MDNILLDNAVKGTLAYTGSTGNTSKIKIGPYSGRKLEYNAINPATGKKGKRFTVLLLVRNHFIRFNVMSSNESADAQKEKDQFLNSIHTTDN